MRPKGILLFGSLVLASGCYSYVATPPAELTPGTPVRMRLTAAQVEALVPQRLTDDRLMDGVLVEHDGSGFLVETSIGHNDAERGMRAVVQRVSVPDGGVLEIEQRTLNKGRTGLAFAAGAVTAGVVLAIQSRGGRGGPDTPGGGTQEARRVPLFRLHLPW